VVTQMQIDIKSQLMAVYRTIRTLSIDAVQQADSGHPSAPMALVILPLAAIFWDPNDMIYYAVFVLSVAVLHMLLCSLLHLCAQIKAVSKNEQLGELSVWDIQRFRQQQQMSRHGVSLDFSVETTSRSPRSGELHQCQDGHCWAMDIYTSIVQASVVPIMTFTPCVVTAA